MLVMVKLVGPEMLELQALELEGQPKMLVRSMSRVLVEKLFPQEVAGLVQAGIVGEAVVMRMGAIPGTAAWK